MYGIFVIFSSTNNETFLNHNKCFEKQNYFIAC